jgi:hypothetical protein
VKLHVVGNFHPLKNSRTKALPFPTLPLADGLTYNPQASAKIPSANQGRNALWLRNFWYRGKYTPPESDAMIARLKNYQI